jgi:signal transduction histidine kinase/HAMP domain-containing protein
VSDAEPPASEGEPGGSAGAPVTGAGGDVAAASGGVGAAGPPLAEGGRLSERISRIDAARRAALEAGDADGPSGEDPEADDATPHENDVPVYRSAGLGFRTRLTLALIAAAVLPVAGFGIVVLIVTGTTAADTPVARVLLLSVAVAVVFAVLLAALLAADLGAPLRAIARSVERVSAGEDPGRLELPGDDEFSRLAESHNRLARDLRRRNRELRQIVVALESSSLGERPDVVIRRAAEQARSAFGMIDCELLLVDPREIPTEELVPGDPIPVRANLAAAGEQLGVVVGHLPATRNWERADQDLFELFAIEVSAAIRNAQLYARVEDQNRRLRELDEAKDDFLRGVSHNLQTPLASIRGYAQQLAADTPDRRLGIITEQADRLSRMVRQLLTVSRIESGALRPRVEVVSPGARVRRTWEALGVADVPFTLEDGSAGWLALADADQLDQVLWALLDNAVVYGGRTPIDVTVSVDAEADDIAITIADHGAGVAEEDRERLFLRFERGSARPADEGSGLGLYVSRELCRAMSGDLELEPNQPGRGAAFTVHLPAETAEES